MLDSLGGRKIIALLLCMIVGAVATATKGDVPHGLLSLMEFLFAGYVAGNGIEHIRDAVTTIKSNRAISTEAVESPSSSNMEELKAANAALAENIAVIQQTLSLIITRTGIDKMPPPA